MFVSFVSCASLKFIHFPAKFNVQLKHCRQPQNVIASFRPAFLHNAYGPLIVL